MEVQFILEILLVPASNSDIEESDFLKLNLIFHLGEMIYCVILQRRDDVEYLLSFGFYELYLLVFVVRVSARGCDIFQMTVHIKYNVRPKKKPTHTQKQQTNKKEHFYFWIFASDNGRFLKEYFLDEDDDYDDDNDTASISMTHNGTRKITLIYVICVTEKLLLHVQ